MSEERFQKVAAPQPGDSIAARGRERIEKVVAYWPDFRAWEVHVVDDYGHRADMRGNPITRMVRTAGFGEWAVIPAR